MPKTLLYVTGFLNLLFGLFHVYLGYEIGVSSTLAQDPRSLLQGLNLANALMIFFLAYVCLMHQRDMLATGLGKAVLLLGTLVYLSRAAEEFFWFQFSPLMTTACLVVGVLHLILLLWPEAKGAAAQA
ncbi:MAG: hypothetical protein ACLQBJ_11075 [Bryobacteraceae bacterium]